MAKEKTFSFHFGSGVIAEEASHAGPYNTARLQLLRFTEGDAAGVTCIRFASYDARGRFLRQPLIVREEDIEGLREALKGAPALRSLLERLVE